MLYSFAITALRDIIAETDSVTGVKLAPEELADLQASIATLQTAANPEGQTFLERLKIEHHNRRHERDLLQVFLDSGKANDLVGTEHEELLKDQLKAQNSLVAVLEKRLSLLPQ